LNIHLRCLVLDGVYRCSADGVPTFVEAGAPTDDELHALLQTAVTRPMKMLTRRGVPVEDMGQTSRSGLADFEHIEFESLTMGDARGHEHVFQFRTQLFAAGVTIDAIELNADQSEGYCFKVIGDEEGDLLELLARLVTKMRRGLASSHLEQGAHGLQISDRGIVRARIESDPEGEAGMPVVVIDGRNISWDEFGRMVATHRGFQFKLELHDLSEET
jgi:hypothetical protein